MLAYIVCHLFASLPFLSVVTPRQLVGVAGLFPQPCLTPYQLLFIVGKSGILW